jgi:ribosome modulation factor
VVLAVDTARRSGWALYVAGRLRASGEVDTLCDEAVGKVVVAACERAQSCGYPLALVLESPFGGTTVVVSALGQARERWLRAWRDAKQSRKAVVLVQPNTWRARVLGRGWRGAKRDELRLAEQRFAAQVSGCAKVGPDEAAAVLIGRWGAQALDVGRAIGEEAMRASLACWRAQTSRAPLTAAVRAVPA